MTLCDANTSGIVLLDSDASLRRSFPMPSAANGKVDVSSPGNPPWGSSGEVFGGFLNKTWSLIFSCLAPFAATDILKIGEFLGFLFLGAVDKSGMQMTILLGDIGDLYTIMDVQSRLGATCDPDVLCTGL